MAHTPPAPRTAAQAEAREAARVGRRRVVSNNRAWRSAETVRREWLATFVQRKTPPKGAEALICEAVVTGHHSLEKAMQQSHRMLLTLLGVTSTDAYHGVRADCQNLIAKASTPKAATMLMLGCVIGAWEDSTGTHTWRNPRPWDTRVMTALAEWGYKPSEVETLLTTTAPPHVRTSDSGNAGHDAPGDAA